MRERKRADKPHRNAAVAIAAALSAVWLAATGTLLWMLGGEGAVWLVAAVAVTLPLGAIWLAALLARRSAELREEADRLAEVAEAVRRAADAVGREPAPAARSAPPEAPAPAPAARPAPAQPAAAAPRHQAGAPMRLTRTAPAQRGEVRQEILPLAVDAESSRVAFADLARALDFPESAEDQEGFRALRLALRDPSSRRLVQASQDMLTLLSEDDIYMDDLEPERTRPEVWRRFAAGERGPTAANVGGIRDRSSLALTAARMRNDPVFRDAAHHFLRLFDRSLAELAPNATDAELATLAETRSARAFMLVGRVAGIFH